jgi:hypothetical protein
VNTQMLTATNCTFTNNSAGKCQKRVVAEGLTGAHRQVTTRSTDRGGALYILGGELDGCTFTGNTGRGEGHGKWSPTGERALICL